MNIIKSESITELTKDLIAAQKTMPHADEDKNNPHFRSKFAGLQSLQKSSKRHLAKHNLVITQLAENNEQGDPMVTTLLLHQSGEYLGSSVSCKADKAGPQALGSTCTYLQRLGLRTVAQIVIGGEDEIPDTDEEESDQTDDDGESATNHTTDPTAGSNRVLEVERAIAACRKVGFSDDMETAFWEVHGEKTPTAMVSELRDVHRNLTRGSREPKKNGMAKPRSKAAKAKVTNDGPIFS